MKENISQLNLTLEGSCLPALLKFIEKELDKNEIDKFSYKANWNRNFDKTQTVDLLSIILMGAASTLGQIFSNFISRYFNNDLLIKVNTEDGKEVTFNFRNKTISEIKILLEELGLSFDNVL